MTENEITYKIRGCIFKVYNKLGPGLLESAYEVALNFEMKKAGLKVDRQIVLPMVYDSVKLAISYRLDFVIEDIIVIEVKSVETLSEVHHKQIITYLRLAGLRLGILVNFNTASISESIYRKIYGF